MLMTTLDKKLIHTVLSEKFQDSPDSIFIESSKGSFSGIKIRNSINETKDLLQKSGLKLEEAVACLISPSPEYVISMLAIWEAGGVIFPLDINLPDDLLKKYLTQVQPTKLLVEKNQVNRISTILKSLFDELTFHISEHKEDELVLFNSSNLSETNEVNLPNPNSGSYILFTSGSTGSAKAIYGQHKSLSHFIHWELKEFNLDSTERVSWLAPTMFDVSLRDILVPLLAGGTLVIPEEQIKRDPRLLLDWIKKEKITTIHMVPSIFRLLTEEISSQKIDNPLPHLRRVFLAGEALYESDVFRWRNVVGDNIELINLYGPSETTLAKLFHRIGSISDSTNQIIPLGQPISNSAVLVLKNSKLCAIGEEGEIYIKTPFRSKGYYDDQELTKTLFLKNPLVQDPNDIIYKTGDLGYYREDRSIVFCGRVDYQLKIHGNRVEPTEIEAVIKSYANIEHVVVLGVEADDHSMQLVAFYSSSEAIGSDELKKHISSQLPKYMIPDRLIRLEKMLFNRNGKIDRNALIDLLKEEKSSGEHPKGEFEKKLAQLWIKLLQNSPVFRTSNFFESGGHSLLAIRLVSAIYREFEIEISINEIFEYSLLKDLAALLEKSEKTEKFSIPKAPESENYSLSHAQRRLWTLDSMQMGGGVMTISSAIKLTGEINLDNWIESWTKIVERHEILRTRIVVIEDEPRQVIHNDKFKVELETVNGKEAVTRLYERLEKLSQEPMSLSENWLFKLRVFKTSNDEHVVFLQIHHIISDAWSLDIIVEEQNEIYTSLINNKPSSLKELPIQYKDYSCWQNDDQADSLIGKSKEYWHKKLAGDLPFLSIPADFSRPRVKTYSGKTISVKLDQNQVKNFREICSRTKSTRFAVALAIFKILLHRLSHQEEVVVGTTIANRSHHSLENQVGFYVQTLALKDSLEDGMVFDEFIKRVNETSKDAFSHSDYPFDQLVDELGIDRNPSHHPIFDAALILHEDSAEDQLIPGLKVEQINLQENSSTYDLFMTVHVVGGEIEIELNFNSDIYRMESAKKFLDVYCHLINSLSDHSSSPLQDLLLIPENEISDTLTQCVGELHPLPQQTLPEQIEANFSQYISKIAIEDSVYKWSYGDLNKRANGIAKRLIENGLNGGDIVAVYIDRGAFAIASLLGIWKAGGVYLPLATDLPEKRLNMILEDSDCGYIISDRELKIHSSARIIQIDDCEPSNSNPNIKLDLEDRAYIIYTSGTTGVPKGVVIKHEGILNTVLDMERFWKMTSRDNCLQFASLSFDASLAEILPALLAGATLFIPDSDTRQSPDLFLKYIQKKNISVALLTPTYLNALGNCDFSGLRLLINAGEAAIVDDLLRYQKQTRVCNAYGPSEASIHATTWFAVDSFQNVSVVPIGKPVANSAILILDHKQQPLPRGFSGEICFSGPGVAEGYLNRPELTSECFVTHPLNSDKIIYRTGDRGRINWNGDVEMLGRLDQQVKVRGHRVEPGEIEKLLETHEDIGRAFVTTTTKNNQTDLIGCWSPVERPALWPSVAEFFVYDEVLYRAMYTDRGRNRQYLATFEKVLKGANVLEVGPGPELVLSRLALDAGAKHVYAVELLEETFLRAKARIEDLGLKEKITLINGDATKVDLPEKVDYCISEIVGGIGGSEGSAKIINEVRHHLTDPSHMIPSRSRTLIAASDLDQDLLLKGFPEIASHYVKRIFEEEGYSFDLRLCVKDFPKTSLCSNSEDFEDLDYTSHMSLGEDHEIRLVFNRKSRFTGFVVWLTLNTDEDHLIDIMETPESWLPIWLPVSIEGIEVSDGDVLTATISRTLSENGLNPDFSLDGTLVRKGQKDVPINLTSLHNKEIFRDVPFYKELFKEGRIPLCETLNESEIKTFLAEQLPSYMVPSALIEVDKFPLTSSGKIDKSLLPLFANDIEIVDKELSISSEEERVLLQAWTGVIGESNISLKDHFFKIGGDSIKAIQLVSRLQENGYRIDMRDIFLYPSLEEMSLNLKPLEELSQKNDPFGLTELLPIQKWFFRTQKSAPEHFNQSVILELDNELTFEQLRLSLQTLYDHHPILRSRLQFDVGTVLEIPEELEDMNISEIDLRDSNDELEDLKKHADKIQRSFNLHEGDFFKAIVFHLSTKSYLLIVAHHLVIDGVSWRILLSNLDKINKQQLESKAIEPLHSTVSFRNWSEAITEFSSSSEIQESAQKWQELLNDSAFEKEKEKTSLLREEFQKVEGELDEEITQFLISESNQTYHTEINDLLLTALSLAFGEHLQKEKILVGMEGTGREIPDKNHNLSETVGWFTSYYLLPISIDSSSELNGSIKSVKEQIRAIPDKGLSYSILSEQADKKPLIPRVVPDILFNYFGDMSNISDMETFKLLDWVAGAEISEKSEISSLFNITAVVEKFKFKASLSYHSKTVNRSKAEELLEKYLANLSSIVLHTKSAKEDLTPSDITASEMDMDDLDSFLGEIELDV
jgi:amino acid adenylation domain-containing protein/non-ribosomal peptide synthase protein (TIGR01720 family)